MDIRYLTPLIIIVGGGNRNAAACQMEGVSIEQALDKIHQAIDEYLAS